MGQPKVNSQSEQKRILNFQEVSRGYSKRITKDESRRCPQCTDPVCQQACPLGIDIPGFIRLLREGNVAGAYEIIHQESSLPAICGRICSAPCEAACVLNEEDAPIGIRALERYASDFGRPRRARLDQVQRKGKKIAIIGAGPAGLSAAKELALKGFQVTLFEAHDKPGGVLRYGIPEFRIPKAILDQEIEEMKALGVCIETNFFMGQTATLDDLKTQGFMAILLAMGAGVPQFMDIPGGEFGGVYYGEEFLMRINLKNTNHLDKKDYHFVMGQHVAVIGSGNTALDCARAAKRLGKEVTLIFRRTEDDMRVRDDEFEFAKQEGIQMEPLVKPIAILPNQDNYVDALRCVRMDYADENNSGQWNLVPVEGSEFLIQADTVLIAIGHRPNSYLTQAHPELKLKADGSIQIDRETFETSIEGVFACGNVVTNAGPIVEAMAAGKKCAAVMENFVR